MNMSSSSVGMVVLEIGGGGCRIYDSGVEIFGENEDKSRTQKCRLLNCMFG